MIEIKGREDLEALNHVQTLESVADNAINELTIQTTIATRALEDLGVRTKEARQYRRGFRIACAMSGFWFAAAMYWMWRAVR